MVLTQQEKDLGIIAVTCKCCGNAYKAHGIMNACSHSLTPNFGCEKCQGIPKETPQPGLTIDKS